jgi:hypothetical protein
MYLILPAESACSCKRDIELSGPIKGAVVLGQLSYYQLNRFSCYSFIPILTTLIYVDIDVSYDCNRVCSE